MDLSLHGAGCPDLLRDQAPPLPLLVPLCGFASDGFASFWVGAGRAGCAGLTFNGVAYNPRQVHFRDPAALVLLPFSKQVPRGGLPAGFFFRLFSSPLLPVRAESLSDVPDVYSGFSFGWESTLSLMCRI